MALSRSNYNELPEDAVVLTPDEALSYQWKIICNWEKPSEVWALKYSPHALGICGALTGIYVNGYYRTKLKLGNYGKLSTYLPIVVMPALMTVIYHKFFVQKDIILETTPCPICLQLRAAAFQTTLGVLYPTLMAPLASFMFATRHYTYRLPSITEKPLELVSIWRKMTKPIVPTIGIIISFQALLAMYITFKESQQNMRVHAKLHELEAKIDADKTENTI